MRVHICRIVALAGALILAGEVVAQAPARSAERIVADAAQCTKLRGLRVDPARIGVPSGLVTITAAATDSEPAAVGAATPFCKVSGEIAPRTAGASPIRFEVNLPATWNRKFIMTGGGGFNGVILGGRGPLRDAPGGIPTPLAKGYATASTDSGHQVSSRDDPEPARFTLNDEMMRNFAFEAYKKTSDVARALMQSYYGKPVRYSYYFGGSEGGREGLTMAQRYPKDFDGIVSVVPVISWTGLMSSFSRLIPTQAVGGGIDRDELQFFANAVMASCDALDGISDGVVNNYLACHRTFSVESLRCPAKPGTARCLSDPQIATLKSAYEPTALPFAVANGLATYPGRLFGGEIQVPGDNFARWISNGKPISNPLTPQDPRGAIYGSNFIRYLIAKDPNYDIAKFDPANFEARIKEISALMDSTNPDLSAFRKHGGKLIIRENAGDSAQSAHAGFRYYESVVARMGQRSVDGFLRLYVSPASAHGGQAFSLTTGEAVPTQRDLLSDLDVWVTSGRPPADALEQVSTSATAPFDVLSARPMCRYPKYPHYVDGDRTKSASYACRASVP